MWGMTVATTREEVLANATLADGGWGDGRSSKPNEWGLTELATVRCGLDCHVFNPLIINECKSTRNLYPCLPIVPSSMMGPIAASGNRKNACYSNGPGIATCFDGLL